MAFDCTGALVYTPLATTSTSSLTIDANVSNVTSSTSICSGPEVIATSFPETVVKEALNNIVNKKLNVATTKFSEEERPEDIQKSILASARKATMIAQSLQRAVNQRLMPKSEIIDDLEKVLTELCDIRLVANEIVHRTDTDGDKKHNELNDIQRIYRGELPVGIDKRNPTKVLSGNPKNIWINENENGYFTTVEWEDGEKTTVKAEDPEKATPYCGFCAAVTKRFYGSTTRAIQKFNVALEHPKIPTIAKERRKELVKKAKEREREKAKRNREERIQYEMDQIRIRNEARERIAAADRRKTEAEGHEGS